MNLFARIIGSAPIAAGIVALAALGASSAAALADEPAPTPNKFPDNAPNLQPPASNLQPGAQPQKPSTYAPAADLAAQVDYYLGRLTDALANQADYDADKQKRVTKDANTLAAIALVLGQHDEKSKYQGSSAAIIKASQALAEAAEDFEPAHAALEELKKAAASGAGEPVAWGEVASLAALMQQVPIVNNGLRRAIEPGKFKKQAALAAQQAATLAAIAEASWHDSSSVSGEAETAEWRKFCEEMRDAAALVNGAAHRGDQPAAASAAKRLALSCDGCHAKFRD